jgi:uncharacterized RmlC-like cupin family protein
MEIRQGLSSAVSRGLVEWPGHGGDVVDYVPASSVPDAMATASQCTVAVIVVRTDRRQPASA